MLAVECIFHFPSREAFFREVQRVLKPGGVLALSDFVPSKLFLPACMIAALPWFREIGSAGHIDTRTTLAAYRKLAVRASLQSLAERDATANTLPTYTYLRRKLGNQSGAGFFGRMLDVSRTLGRLGLLNYQLLSFRKP